MEMVQAFNDKARRTTANLQPSMLRGKRYGYVREGDTWYPASVNTDFQGQGLFDNSNAVNMQYGHSVIFRPVTVAGVGSVLQPFFADANNRTFEINDEILANRETGDLYDRSDPDSGNVRFASKQTIDQWDQLRNWYFLSDDEVMDGVMRRR